MKQRPQPSVQGAFRCYRRQVRRQLACLPVHRGQLLADLDDALARYAVQRPDAALEELYAYFGAPEQFAANVLANMDGLQLQAQLAAYCRRQRLRFAAVTAALVCALVIALLL